MDGTTTGDLAVKAVIYQFSDFATEVSHNELIPLEKLDALTLEERLPALYRHIDELNKKIDRLAKKNKAQLRKLRRAQARFRKTVRTHRATLSSP